MICRMCLLDSTEMLHIFEEENKGVNIASTIAKHFWFEPKCDDPISNIICNICWWKIESFNIYYESIEDVHRKLSERFSVKNESGHSHHHHHQPQSADAGVQVLLKLNEDNTIEENLLKIEEGTEVLVIEVKEHELSDYESSFEHKQCESEAKDENTLIEISRLEDLPEETAESIENESLNVPNAEKVEETDSRHSRYLEAQKNLKEFIRIESVENVSTRDDNNDEDSDDAPLITEKRKRRKTLTARTKDKEKIRPEKLDSTNEYTLKSREDDLKIAQHMKLKCDLCGNEYPTFAEVKRHFRNVHKQKGYVMCCNKKLYKRVLILDHVYKHLDPDYFKCNECNKVFADKQCLKNHMMRHESDDAKMFRCEHCPRRFAKQYLLDQHKHIHMPQDQRQYFCEDCGKAFPTNNLLQTHRRYVHEKAYGQMCHICAKVIRGKRLFAKHQLEHAGVTEPKVQCQICGAWLKNPHSLRKHIVRHNESQDEHVCSTCGKTAPSKGALRSHIRYVHSSSRRFKCSVCEKGFKKAIVLKEHMTTHTGEVLYTCAHCPKTFNSHANMHAHRKKVHKKEWEEERKNRGRPTEATGTVENRNDISENSLDNLSNENINLILYENDSECEITVVQ